MSALSDKLAFLAFEAPHLGIPPKAGYSARRTGPNGGFVEVFLDVRDGRVAEVGFLTDMAMEGMLCASLWCESVTGASLETAWAVSARQLAGHFPLGYPPPLAVARTCVRAGRAALVKAGALGDARQAGAFAPAGGSDGEGATSTE